MLLGRVAKGNIAPLWSAECAVIGAATQGKSRADACAMLAGCIEGQSRNPMLKVTVTKIDEDEDGVTVLIDANEPALLAAEVLKYQRAKHRLSQADVAAKLGASSVNAYSSYEQGKREPSLSKFRELLAVVAPELMLSVGPRKSGR